VGYRLLLPHTDKLAGFHLHYFFIRAVEWGWVHSVRRSVVSPLHQPRMVHYYGAVGGMRIDTGNRSTQRKPASAPFFYTTDSTWSNATLNPGGRGGKSATNRLSMAWRNGSGRLILSIVYRSGLITYVNKAWVYVYRCSEWIFFYVLLSVIYFYHTTGYVEFI
jgi:hypothetical protein